MTGWRVGLDLRARPVAELCVRVHQYTMLCAPHVSQLAAMEALEHADADVDEMVADYDRGAAFRQGACARSGWTARAGGAFYAFPSIRLRAGLGSLRRAAAARAARGRGARRRVRPLREGHVRCSYATALPQLEEALVRIDRFLRGL
jgi:aminotransferase